MCLTLEVYRSTDRLKLFEMKTRDEGRNDDKRLEHGFWCIRSSCQALPILSSLFLFLCLIEVPYCSPFKVIRSKIKEIAEAITKDIL